PGEPVDRGAAGVAQPEKARALVEGLARSVVQRRPQNGEALALAHIEDQRVPATCEQAEKRRIDVLWLEVERRDVPVQVVHWDQRQAARPGDRLRRGDADEQSADEARPASDRNGVDLVER